MNLNNNFDEPTKKLMMT